ncbi:MAG: protein kinase, partial [Polyangiaceae bacterium]|nr:protein kinase [Polyangiaceae bacterium]
TGTRGFQRVVAIKIILPALSDDPRFEQMFLDEAALAARIRHPNVVQVIDLGEEGELLYQVMEWIDGEPLVSILRKLSPGRSIPFPIAARIMIGACEGLHAAHELRDDSERSVGLVHRDVSPQNILVTRDGVTKVVDFGVAKVSTLTLPGGLDPRALDSRKLDQHTSGNVLKGKPAYMAPEQIQGLHVDRRADIFSLGIVLYVLTTSYHPFRGDTDRATLQNTLMSQEADLPSSLVPGYPVALEQVVMKAVSKDRDYRYRSASSMARALEAAVPDVRSVGDADVALYIRILLADRLEAQASALRAALVDADKRAAGRPSQSNMTTPSQYPNASTSVAPSSVATSVSPPAASPTATSSTLAASTSAPSTSARSAKVGHLDPLPSFADEARPVTVATSDVADVVQVASEAAATAGKQSSPVAVIAAAGIGGLVTAVAIAFQLVGSAEEGEFGDQSVGGSLTLGSAALGLPAEAVDPQAGPFGGLSAGAVGSDQQAEGGSGSASTASTALTTSATSVDSAKVPESQLRNAGSSKSGSDGVEASVSGTPSKVPTGMSTAARTGDSAKPSGSRDSGAGGVPRIRDPGF